MYSWTKLSEKGKRRLAVEDYLLTQCRSGSATSEVDDVLERLMATSSGQLDEDEKAHLEAINDAAT